MGFAHELVQVLIRNNVEAILILLIPNLAKTWLSSLGARGLVPIQALL